MRRIAFLLAISWPGAAARRPRRRRRRHRPPPRSSSSLPGSTRIFSRFQQEAHVPGLVWGIVRDGRLVHVGGAGVQDLESRRPVNAETLFRIASMSKAFTALAILKLRDEGRLSLEAPAETYVPELRGWRYPTSDSPRLRVRDLLSHLGGFVTDDPWGDRQTPLPEAEFSAMLRAGVPFTRPPQTGVRIFELRLRLLGRIVTNVSGRPFKDYIKAEIMGPLGMASTGYDIARSPRPRRALGYRWENEAWSREPDMARGAFGAMGGVQTSANDYAAGSPSCSPPGRPRRRRAGAGAARDGARAGAGLELPALGRRPGGSRRRLCRRPPPTAWGCGSRSIAMLGLTLAHGGGYPGYGSYLLLLPDHGIGLFALDQPHLCGAVRAGLGRGDGAAGRAGCAGARSRSARRWRPPMARRRHLPGRRAGARPRPAGDELPDGPLGRELGAELARLKSEVGDCATDAPITATGALAGRFQWPCERGRIDGQLLLAPTHPPTIQALRLGVARTAGERMYIRRYIHEAA